MTTVLRASDSAEFLSIVPALAGFTPRHSVVLLPFRGKRTYGAMRIDPPRDDADVDEYVSGAIALLRQVPQTDAVAIVVYSDDDAQQTGDGLVLPFDVTVEALVRHAEEAELRVVDALCVTSQGWACYLDDDPELLPVLDTVQDLPGLEDVSGDQYAGLELPASDLVEREQVGRALIDLDEAIAHDLERGLTGNENPLAIAALALIDDPPAFFETVLDDAGDLSMFATAALVWCLGRPLLRDVALSQWATDLSGGYRAFDLQLEFVGSSTPAPEELGMLFMGKGATPSAERLQRALEVTRIAASRAPRASRPGPLTVAAWLSWALGRTTHTQHYLELVREIDPRYGLAELIGTMIGASMLPDWVLNRGAGPSRRDRRAAARRSRRRAA